MATRIVEGKKPYTGGKAIEIDENKVISLRLREENNLIIRDEGDNEIYVDLQLPDGITPLDAFPVGITVGRVLIADDWDVNGTLVVFKTTSGDNIKLLYGDDGKLYIDNGTGLFKQIYLKGEVDALLQALRDYVDAQLALKQDKLIAGDYIEIDNNVISAVIPTMSRFLSIWNASSGEPISFPASTPFLYTTGDYYLIEGVGVSDNYRPAPIEYDGSASTIPETEEVADGDVYIYDGATWLLQSNHGKTVTFQNIAGDPYDNTNLATALNAKQNTLVNQSNIKSINNQSLLGSGDLSIAEVPSGGTNGQVLTKTSQGPSWQNATGGAEIEYLTQIEYNALPSSKLTDGKHYYIFSSDQSGWQPNPSRTIFYYEFNNNLNDGSGNQHAATSSQGIGYNTVGDQNVVEVTNGYSSISVDPSWCSSIGSGDFTISFWINPVAPDSGRYPLLFGVFSNNAPYTGPNIFFDPWDANGHGDCLVFRMRGGSSSYEHPSTTTASSLYNSWHHVVMTRINGEVSCYIDNNLEVSWSNDTEVVPSTNAEGDLLGRVSFDRQTWLSTGAMADKYILENVGWTAQEISDYYNQTRWEYQMWQPGANTLVYYNINDNDTNSTIYDLSGNGVDQTWYGTPGYTTDATYGRVATFDGSSYASSGSIVNFGGECTFIALVNLNDFSGGIVIECASSSTYGVGLACVWGDNTNRLCAWYSGVLDGNAIIQTTSSVTANQWVMLASTRAADGTAKIYINGVLNNTVSGMLNPTYTNPENLAIGKRRVNNNYLNGQFKLFIGENRTWTDQEIADLASEYGF